MSVVSTTHGRGSRRPPSGDFRHRHTPSLAWCLVLGAGLVLAAQVGAGETFDLRGPLPDRIEAIDVVLIEGQSPTVMLLPSKPTSPPMRRRLHGNQENLLAVGEDLEFEGDCTAVKLTDRADTRLRIQAAGTGRCRVGLALVRHEDSLDILSGTELRVQGRNLALEAVTLTDRHGRQATAYVAPAEPAGPLDHVVRLAPMAREMDLRDVVAMTVALRPGLPVGELEAVTLDRTGANSRPSPRTGFWVWDYREAMADPDSMIATCRDHGCERLLLQMPGGSESDELWSRYVRTLDRIRSAGIEAYALDGYPAAIFQPQRLAAKIERVLSLMNDDHLAGIQLDIEPYVLEGFAAGPDGYRRYLNSIRVLKNAVAGRTSLSIVMPFWFASTVAEGRAVAFSVMDVADEVAVMSYRTDLDELQAVADDVLRYGDVIGVPVWLAVETRALPIERHVRLDRVESPRLATAYLDREGKRLVLAPPSASSSGEWFRVLHRTTVRPERVTFSGRTRAMVEGAVHRLLARLRNPSLAGMLIHDLTGFRMLAPQE